MSSVGSYLHQSYHVSSEMELFCCIIFHTVLFQYRVETWSQFSRILSFCFTGAWLFIVWFHALQWKAFKGMDEIVCNLITTRHIKVWTRSIFHGMSYMYQALDTPVSYTTGREYRRQLNRHLTSKIPLFVLSRNNCLVIVASSAIDCDAISRM